MLERLHKVLAHAGIASRRECERIIAAGRVSVNGNVVREMGVRVDPDVDDIRCDGVRVQPEKRVYFLLNKPKGYICTNADELGRRRAVDLLDRVPERIYTVGRLDQDSEGLIILTNDGTFADLMAHPRHQVPKTYLAEIGGKLNPEGLQRLQKGVWLAGGRTRGAEVRILYRGTKRCTLEVTIREGKNREIRRILAKTGHPVRKLRRIRIGPIADKRLKPGRFRLLKPWEIQRLVEAAKSKKGTPSPASRSFGL